MTLPASGYLSNAARTNAENKVAFEAMRDAVAELLGGSARTELTISGGAIVPPAGAGGGVHTVDTEGNAASDDLDVITTTNTPAGRLIRLYAENAARVVTLQDANGGAGEMLMEDSADFVLDALDKWIEFQLVGTSWIETMRSHGVDQADFRTQHGIPKLVAHHRLCPHKNLAGSRPSVTSVTFTADELVLEDASGNQLKVASFNKTAAITTSGAAGLDTGAEASSTWYHIWAIAKADGTQSILLSLATAIGSLTFPSGYTYAGYLGAVYNSSGSDFVDFNQKGDEVGQFSSASVLSGGSATTFTSVSLAANAPSTARIAKLLGTIGPSSGTAACDLSVASDGSGTTPTGDFTRLRVPVQGTVSTAQGMLHVLMTTAQQVKYYVSGTNAQASLAFTGWRF